MAEKPAFARCPNCGGRMLKTSQPRGAWERFKSWFGTYHFRCRNCNHRFEVGLLTISDWRYARCPRCYRTELSTWSEQYYNPPLKTRTLLTLGATPYRCETCRCNFASFLACKERYSWRKAQPVTSAQDDAGKSS